MGFKRKRENLRETTNHYDRIKSYPDLLVSQKSVADHIEHVMNVEINMNYVHMLT